MKFSDFLTFIGTVWFSLLFIYITWTFFLKSQVQRFLIYKRGKMTSAEVVYFQDSLAKVQYRPLCYIKLKFQTEQGQVITENLKVGEFKHEVRQFEKSYDNQQAEQISLMV
ncbi:hypothetical protein BTG60_04505, partial [Acinetobacter pittii]